MGATDTYETQHLLAAFSTGHFSGFPATYYVALFSVTPTDAGGGTEFVIGTGAYARVAYANTDANWTVAAGQAKNAVSIAFPTATAAWGSAVAWGLMTAASGGSLVHYNALLSSPVVCASGDTPTFAINQLIITAD